MNDTVHRIIAVVLMGFHSPKEVAGTEALLGPPGDQFIPAGTRDPADRVGADQMLQPRQPAAFHLQPEAP